MATDTAAGWRVVWITGASSGIGRELALRLARRGITVAASARSADVLSALAADEPLIKPYPLDVTDRAAVAATFTAIEREVGPVDLAILSAGVFHDMSARHFDVDKIEQAMAVNYLGMIYALESLIPAMRARRSGHVAMVASISGYIGLPRALAYGPTKAAINSLAQSLKPDLDRHRITVSVVNPGFVDTPMARAQKFPLPMIVPLDEAVNRILEGLDQRRFEIAFPIGMKLLLGLARRAPYPLYFWFLRRLVYNRGLGG